MTGWRNSRPWSRLRGNTSWMSWPAGLISGTKRRWPMATDQRYSRQRDIVPAERLSKCKATVIGVGAIGRQVALQLAAMGISWLQLVDFDTVEESNLASQGYLEDDLGRPKVQATADLCQQINHGLEVHEDNDSFRRSME